MKKADKVCIMTSAHPPFNTRVFHKQAKSIARAGYDVVLIAPHRADETVDGVRIKAVSEDRGKLGRMLVTTFRVLGAGLAEDASLYHFHDPELIPAGLLLKLMGRKVVYDVHEYYRMKVMDKKALPMPLRRLIGSAYDAFENAAARAFDGVVAVDSVIEDKLGGRAVRVSNFPYLPDEEIEKTQSDPGCFTCVYVGGLSGARGFFKMVEAMGQIKGRVKLLLAGYGPESYRLKAEKFPGYEKVEWLGFRKWQEAIKIVASSDLGLLLLQPTPSYRRTGEGIAKLFEYMMLGVPVLCSDFPHVKRIVEGEGCGMCVDPTDPVEIARAIVYLSERPELRAQMGENGRRAVREKYNWGNEEKKLLALYGRILGRR